MGIPQAFKKQYPFVRPCLRDPYPFVRPFLRDPYPFLRDPYPFVKALFRDSYPFLRLFKALVGIRKADGSLFKGAGYQKGSLTSRHTDFQ